MSFATLNFIGPLAREAGDVHCLQWTTSHLPWSPRCNPIPSTWNAPRPTWWNVLEFIIHFWRSKKIQNIGNLKWRNGDGATRESPRCSVPKKKTAIKNEIKVKWTLKNHQKIIKQSSSITGKTERMRLLPMNFIYSPRAQHHPVLSVRYVAEHLGKAPAKKFPSRCFVVSTRWFGRDRGWFRRGPKTYGGFHSHGGTPARWMVFLRENPSKMDVLGVPLWLRKPKLIKTLLLISDRPSCCAQQCQWNSSARAPQPELQLWTVEPEHAHSGNSQQHEDSKKMLLPTLFVGVCCCKVSMFAPEKNNNNPWQQTHRLDSEISHSLWEKNVSSRKFETHQVIPRCIHPYESSIVANHDFSILPTNIRYPAKKKIGRMNFYIHELSLLKKMNFICFIGYARSLFQDEIETPIFWWCPLHSSPTGATNTFRVHCSGCGGQRPWN